MPEPPPDRGKTKMTETDGDTEYLDFRRFSSLPIELVSDILSYAQLDVDQAREIYVAFKGGREAGGSILEFLPPLRLPIRPPRSVVWCTTTVRAKSTLLCVYDFRSYGNSGDFSTEVHRPVPRLLSSDTHSILRAELDLTGLGDRGLSQALTDALNIIQAHAPLYELKAVAHLKHLADRIETHPLTRIRDRWAPPIYADPTKPGREQPPSRCQVKNLPSWIILDYQGQGTFRHLGSHLSDLSVRRIVKKQYCVNIDGSSRCDSTRIVLRLPKPEEALKVIDGKSPVEGAAPTFVSALKQLSALTSIMPVPMIISVDNMTMPRIFSEEKESHELQKLHRSFHESHPDRRLFFVDPAREDAVREFLSSGGVSVDNLGWNGMSLPDDQLYPG